MRNITTYRSNEATTWMECSHSKIFVHVATTLSINHPARESFTVNTFLHPNDVHLRERRTTVVDVQGVADDVVRVGDVGAVNEDGVALAELAVL